MSAQQPMTPMGGQPSPQPTPMAPQPAPGAKGGAPMGGQPTPQPPAPGEGAGASQLMRRGAPMGGQSTPQPAPGAKGGAPMGGQPIGPQQRSFVGPQQRSFGGREEYLRNMPGLSTIQAPQPMRRGGQVHSGLGAIVPRRR